MANVEYEIIKELGVISERDSGWSKQLNLISWNGSDPKYDIREWSSNREKAGRGVTLSAAELQALGDLINDIDL